VAPGTKVLHLKNGDWIKVKKRLTVGEQRLAFQKAVGEVNSDGWRRPNLEMQGVSEVHAYILDWGGDGFKDAQGHEVEPSIDALLQLDPEDYKEIDEVVKAHIEAMDKEREEQKKIPNGSSESEATSSSVSG